MARIWDRTPGLSFSDALPFAFGVEFEADLAVTAEGVWFFGIEGAPEVTAVRLYATATQALLASGPGGAAAAGWNLFPFTTPFNCQTGVSYTGAVATGPGTFAYDISGSLPVTSVDGHVVAVQGRFDNTGAAGFPASTWTGLHEVDVEYELTDEPLPAVVPSAERTLVVAAEPNRLTVAADPRRYRIPAEERVLHVLR